MTDWQTTVVLARVLYTFCCERHNLHIFPWDYNFIVQHLLFEWVS